MLAVFAKYNHVSKKVRACFLVFLLMSRKIPAKLPAFPQCTEYCGEEMFRRGNFHPKPPHAQVNEDREISCVYSMKKEIVEAEKLPTRKSCASNAVLLLFRTVE